MLLFLTLNFKFSIHFLNFLHISWSICRWHWIQFSFWLFTCYPSLWKHSHCILTPTVFIVSWVFLSYLLFNFKEPIPLERNHIILTNGLLSHYVHLNSNSYITIKGYDSVGNTCQSIFKARIKILSQTWKKNSNSNYFWCMLIEQEAIKPSQDSRPPMELLMGYPGERNQYHWCEISSQL